MSTTKTFLPSKYEWSSSALSLEMVSSKIRTNCYELMVDVTTYFYSVFQKICRKNRWEFEQSAMRRILRAFHMCGTVSALVLRTLERITWVADTIQFRFFRTDQWFPKIIQTLFSKKATNFCKTKQFIWMTNFYFCEMKKYFCSLNMKGT